MVQSMEQETIEGAMDGASDGSESNRRSDGWCERWIREQAIDQDDKSKEVWIRKQ